MRCLLTTWLALGALVGAPAPCALTAVGAYAAEPEPEPLRSAASDDLDLRAPLDAPLPRELEAVVAATQSAFVSGRYVEVLDGLQGMLPTLRDRFGDDHPHSLWARRLRGFSTHAISGSTEGLEDLEEVVRISDALELDPITQGGARNLAAVAQLKEDRWESALEHLRIAATLLAEAGPHDMNLDAAVARNTAVTWARAGTPERGTEVLRDLLAGVERTEGAKSVLTLQVRVDLGRYQRLYGDPAEAQETLEQAHADSVRILGPDHEVMVQSRVELARTLVSRKRFTEAIAMLRANLESFTSGDYSTDHIAQTYLVLGHTQSVVGDPAWRGVLDRGVAFVKETRGQDDYLLADLYDVILQTESRPQDADFLAFVGMAEEAIRIRAQTFGPRHHKTVESEIRLIRLYEFAGKTDRARALLDDLIERSGGEDEVTTIQMQQELAVQLFETDALAESLEVRRSMRRRIDLLPDDVVGLFGTINEIYIAWTLLRMERLEEAEPIIEAAARELNAGLLDLLAQNGESAVIYLVQQWDIAANLLLSIRTDSRFDRANWEELLSWRGFGGRLLAHRAERVRQEPGLRSLAEERTEVRRRIADRLSAAAREGQGGELDGIESLRAEAEGLEQRLLERLGAAPGPSELAPGIEDLCEALPPRSRLLHIVGWSNLGAERRAAVLSYDAFVLDAGSCSVRQVRLGPKKPIDSRVRRWRSAITATGADPALAERLGEELSEVLLAPLAAELEGADQLVIVPDTALSLVGWAGLPHPDGGYLVEQAEITVFQDVADVLREPRRLRQRERSLLVGGVEYGDGESGGERADRFACLGGSFSALPGTRSELDAIVDTVPGSVQRLAGTAATTEAVRRGMERATHIHLATHGFFLDERCVPEDSVVDTALSGAPLARSGLALAGANDGAGLDGDGLLTAEEVLDLDLSHTQLVVLSACDTGRGELTKGQGVLGLRWALALAGARTQVFSLWPIPDAETAELMADFYEALGAGNACRRCGPAAALQYAQRRALKRQRAAGEVDVRTWAAFEVSGALRR